MKGDRVKFPEHLNKIRSSMPEVLKILEDGRENDWYAFIWLEEIFSRSVTIGKIENVAESTDRGMV
ncbi:MAG: hypothetical protein OEZ34_02270, partial [Spirochaetia bacterium]|nr:hypothetical protein [Spirochaetia bacterium]